MVKSNFMVMGVLIVLTPSFSIANAVWMENGAFTLYLTTRRGEYGKKWHDAGTKMQKQNVFDDFIAAAEYLIAQKYTSSDFLAIRGGSNGGLLVGATMTQRPELMKLPAVGVMDMLRYHTFHCRCRLGTIMEQHKIVKKCLNTLKAILLYTM
jgi:prolyl oligopeptidase